MNITALSTHARLFVEQEYHATISTQDAFLVASAAVKYVAHRGDYLNAVEFLKTTELRGRPPLEDAFTDLVDNVLG